MSQQAKMCGKCATEKPLEDFYRDKNHKLGRAHWCKACASAYEKARYWKDPERERALSLERYRKNHAQRRATSNAYCRANREKIMARKVLYNYGLSPEKYEAMYRTQGGVCAICRELNICGRRLAVDHDHKTGKVRGLLCAKCNLVLGQARESVDLLYRAADYLLAPERVGAGHV